MFRLISGLLVILASNAVAAENLISELDHCLLSSLKKSSGDKTVEEIKKECLIKTEKNKIEQGVDVMPRKLGALSSRIVSERLSEQDPHVITPHKMNYILPVIVSDEINTEPYSVFPTWPENLDDAEAKFQISLKVPLAYEDLFTRGDGLYFGFTVNSWWQIYSENISKPFRETNYQPEFFYIRPLSWQPFGGNTGLVIGAEHQSNGRGDLLSRSWNRLYVNFLYEKTTSLCRFALGIVYQKMRRSTLWTQVGMTTLTFSIIWDILN